MGLGSVSITSIDCFVLGAEVKANRSHTASKTLNSIFEFGTISSTNIITKNLPGFSSDNKRYCIEFIST